MTNTTTTIPDNLLGLAVLGPYLAVRASLWTLSRTVRLIDHATDTRYLLWERLPWWAKVQTQKERDASWQRFLESMRSEG
mgnify:CR=1